MNRIFDIRCDNPAVQTTITPISAEDGISLYRISVTLPEKMTPPPVTVMWEEDMVDHIHGYTPLWGMFDLHQSFGSPSLRSSFHFGAPMIATMGARYTNRYTVALSDPITPLSLRFWVNDLPQEYKVAYSVTLFDGACDDIASYEVLMRIDGRPQMYYEAIGDVYPWWKSLGWEIPQPPAAAEDPLYSSWYNFHQAPRQDKLLEDLKIAAELGFKTVILDDGWQFPGPSTGGYNMCGAWQMSEDKFPDFKKFCDEVHALGMKLMVWFAVPFLGEQSPLYEQYKDRLLCRDYGAGILDVRYPEVRAYIISNYKRFLVDYDIDGFKLDFIDAFQPRPETPAYDPAVMDCETAVEGVRKLLSEIEEQLSAIKPDLLYEYRQNYVGPAINRFGNMLRVGDCAYDSLINRGGIVTMRLYGYPVAIHADMLFWASGESLELCARQLLNIFFGVPQISVILADSTEEQKALLRAYLSYWTENRDLILHGKLRADYPEYRYARVSAEQDDRIIAVHYTDLTYTYDGRACDIHHSGVIEGLIFENPTDRELTAEISVFFGAKHLETIRIPANSIVRLPVPVTGMVRIL